MRLRIAMAAAAALGLGAVAGGCDGSDGAAGDLSFDVDLVDGCGVATPFYFGVRSVEVQLRGSDSGAPCVAARRCITLALDPDWDPEVIEAALRNAAPPLLSSDRPAEDFKIIGSDSTNCSFSSADEVFLCGVAALSQVSGGVLEVSLECSENGTDLPVCPIEPLPDCP